MAARRSGCFHLFRFAGIDVFLHWSWFLIAFYIVASNAGLRYSSVIWNVFECLGLFGIVVLHEFGHSLACRSVGGRADTIVLWPLGGVAFVDPPQRPGATLWSLAAGPLVNVLLIPLLTMAHFAAKAAHLDESWPNTYQLINSIWLINLVLLCFNMLPIYPLDGGQIVRSLLWFIIGRARSLMVASVLGLVAAPLLLILVVTRVGGNNTWLIIIGVFVVMNCWNGVRQARALMRVSQAPRRAGLICPVCHAAPPVGTFWVCGRCRTAFDIFETRGVCPNCGTIFNNANCTECGAAPPIYAYGHQPGPGPDIQV